MKHITLQDILDLAPCYRPGKVEALWAEHAGDRESIRPSDLVGIVPDDDAMWVLAHLAPERTAREAACDWAERALRLAGVTEERSWCAVEVARRYARGEATAAELDVAMGAACSATWSAARDAAWSAARAAAAAGVAARSAAYRGMLLDLVERMEDA